MSTTADGRRAETIVSAFLVSRGCDIIAQNWRTRRCEIDIVACRNGIIYFCEVKYRRSDTAGSGILYVTPKKLAQMRFAAESWVHYHQWQGEYQLCAAEVSGPEFRITRVIKDLG